MYIIHYWELALKGGNRRFFEKKLMDSINLKLRKIGDVVVKKKYGKFIVNSEDERIAEILRTTPWISYFAKAEKVPLDIEKIKKAFDKYFPNEFQSFKVETKRTNKNFAMKSPEISVEVGKYISQKFGIDAKYKKPDVIYRINIAEKEAYVFVEKVYWVGGLPVGSSGRVISLLSWWIDSPVASYMLMKRGCEVFGFHAYAKSLDPEKVKEKVLKLAEKLAHFQWKFILYLLPYEKIQREIVQWVDEKYRMLLFKRSIVRLANRLARYKKAKAVVMGDSLGQVASQTIENIQCVYGASKIPVFSPLIGFDKQEIVDLSKKIWTFEISILPYDDCCSLIVGKHPWTKWQIAILEDLEKEIMIDVVEEKVWEEMEKLEFDFSL